MPRKVSKDWNTYEGVKSGEVCTILTAKKLGIYDQRLVVQDPYNDLKTYATYVSGDAVRTKQLCNQNTMGDSSYNACELEHGMGFMRKPGTVNQCTPVDCPPNFKDDGKGGCKKPIVPLIINASSKCDEKTYDWYTINNYHLGNTFQFHGNKCQAPCPLSYVPNYGTNPVDGSKISDKATDDLSKCVTKKEYMSGKYGLEQDFCPISWVKRMDASPSTLEAEIVKNLPEYLASNVTNSKIGQQIKDYVKETAKSVAKDCGNVVENVVTGSDAMQQACKKMSSNVRMLDAYAVCERLNADPEAIKKRWATEMKEPANRCDDRLNVMRQACNALFCQDKSNSAALLNKDSICFKNVARVKPSNAQQKAGMSSWTVAGSDGSGTAGGSNVQSTVMDAPSPKMFTPFLFNLYATLRRIASVILAILMALIVFYIVINIINIISKYVIGIEDPFAVLKLAKNTMRRLNMT